MTDNLALWTTVEKTPPDQTKAITGKPYKGTSPKPYWLVKRATEVFGPIGIGWGFEILDERIEDGSEGVKVHIARVRVWYDWGGKRGTVEHVGQTTFSGRNRNGAFTDEDAPKKSVTDALVKALSMIGFAGDIFIGRYDDSKYIDELRTEARGRGNDFTPNPQVYTETCLPIIRATTDKTALENWWKDEGENRRKHGISSQQLETLKDAVMVRLDELTTPQKEAAE